MNFKFFIAYAVFVAASAGKQDDESLMKILANERKEMRELFQRETARLEKVDRKLHEKNEEQSQEIQQLKEKLRQADLVTKNSLRQKEQNGSVDFETKVKKIVDAQINNFLINEKICVSGIFPITSGGSTSTVEFHHTFPRPPTVSASLASVSNKGNYASHTQAYAEVKKVTTTSAGIYRSITYEMDARVAWIACL